MSYFDVAEGTALGLGDLLGGSGISGTATCPGPSTGGAVEIDGTATVDRTDINAHTIVGRQRVSGARVEVEGVDLDIDLTDPMLRGSISWKRTLETPVPSASFSIAHPRVAAFATNSLSLGEKPCEVFAMTGESGYMSEKSVFIGKMEASRNEGAFRPMATFRAVADSDIWATAMGCLSEPALSYKHRGQLIRQFFESAIPGATILNANIDTLGGIVTKPIEMSGISTVQAIKNLAEVDGLIPRENNGQLELLDEDELLTGASIWDFDESNMISLAEEPPSRPVTIYHLSGTRLSPATLGPGGQVTPPPDVQIGTDSNGNTFITKTYLTLDQGVELRRRVEWWTTIEPDGVTLGTLGLRLTKVEESETEWETMPPAAGHTGPPFYRYTTRALRQRSRRYEFTGIPCDASTGYLWLSGGRYTTTAAALILTVEQLDLFTWQGALAPWWKECSLERQTSTVSGYYSPLVDPAESGACLYADGSWRRENTFQWQTVEETVDTWDDNRAITAGWVGSVVRRLATSKYKVIKRADSPNEAMFVEAIDGDSLADLLPTAVQTTIWTPNSSNTRYTRSSSVTDVSWYLADKSGTVPDYGSKVESFEGPCPGAPRGSSEVPQISQEVFFVNVDVTAGLLAAGTTFASVELTETNPYLEDENEAIALALRLIRRSLCVRVIIQTRDVPALREGDHVTVTDHARGLALKDGYIWDIERRRDYPGIGQMTLTVMLPLGYP